MTSLQIDLRGSRVILTGAEGAYEGRGTGARATTQTIMADGYECVPVAAVVGWAPRYEGRKIS